MLIHAKYNIQSISGSGLYWHWRDLIPAKQGLEILTKLLVPGQVDEQTDSTTQTGENSRQLTHNPCAGPVMSLHHQCKHDWLKIQQKNWFLWRVKF